MQITRIRIAIIEEAELVQTQQHPLSNHEPVHATHYQESYALSIEEISTLALYRETSRVGNHRYVGHNT